MPASSGRPELGPARRTNAAPLLRPLPQLPRAAREVVGGIAQGGVVPLKPTFLSGAMRGTFRRRMASSTSSARAAGRRAASATAASSACATREKNRRSPSACTPTRTACSSPSANRSTAPPPRTPAATPSSAGTTATPRNTARRIGPSPPEQAGPRRRGDQIRPPPARWPQRLPRNPHHRARDADVAEIQPQHRRRQPPSPATSTTPSTPSARSTEAASGADLSQRDSPKLAGRRKPPDHAPKAPAPLGRECWLEHRSNTPRAQFLAAPRGPMPIDMVRPHSIRKEETRRVIARV